MSLLMALTIYDLVTMPSLSESNFKNACWIQPMNSLSPLPSQAPKSKINFFIVKFSLYQYINKINIRLSTQFNHHPYLSWNNPLFKSTQNHNNINIYDLQSLYMQHQHIPAQCPAIGQTCRHCDGHYGWKFIRPCQCPLIHENCLKDLVHRSPSSECFGHMEYKCTGCSCVIVFRKQFGRQVIPCFELTCFETIQIIWYSIVLLLMGASVAASLILEYPFQIKIMQWVILGLCAVIFPYRIYVASTYIFYQPPEHTNRSIDFNS